MKQLQSLRLNYFPWKIIDGVKLGPDEPVFKIEIEHELSL